MNQKGIKSWQLFRVTILIKGSWALEDSKVKVLVRKATICNKTREQYDGEDI